MKLLGLQAPLIKENRHSMALLYSVYLSNNRVSVQALVLLFLICKYLVWVKSVNFTLVSEEKKNIPLKNTFTNILDPVKSKSSMVDIRRNLCSNEYI